MDLDNIQKKYGLPAPLPVVQNGKFAPRFPLNLEHRGDDVFQFGGKYIGEIENIYDLLYKILTNQEIDASLALPYAIKITEDKLYIRDKTNSEWILIFDITKPNFPKEIELYELIYKAITHQVIGEDTSYPGQFKIEENILYVRDKDNLTWTQIGDVTKEFLGATEATQAILDQVNEILTEVQELKTELNRQIATTNETLTTALKAANEAMTSAQSINIRTFNSVEEMKASNTLKAGALAKTLGFYTAGDGGGADYVITNDIGEDETDEASIITLQKGLYAKLIIQDYVNIKQCGAKGDGETDDTEALQKAINISSKVVIPKGVFVVSKSLSLKDNAVIYGIGEDSVIKKSGDENVYFNLFTDMQLTKKYTFSTLTFDGNCNNFKHMYSYTTDFGDYKQLETANEWNLFTSSADILVIENCKFKNIHGNAISNTSNNLIINNCDFNNIEGASAVRLWGGQNLWVVNSRFNNVNVFPDTLYINGAETAFEEAVSNKYSMQYGDAVSSFCRYSFIHNNLFKNISRMAFTHDMNVALNMTGDNCSICTNNIIIHDSDRLKNSNPQSSIWIEQAKNTIVKGNKIYYKNRNVNEQIGTAIIVTHSMADSSNIIIDNIIRCDEFNHHLDMGIRTGYAEKGNTNVCDNIIKGKALYGIAIYGHSEAEKRANSVIANNNNIYLTAIDGTTSRACLDITAISSADNNWKYLPYHLEIGDNVLDDDGCCNTEGISSGSIMCGYYPDLTQTHLIIDGNICTSHIDFSWTSVPKKCSFCNNNVKSYVTIGRTDQPFYTTFNNNYVGGTATINFRNSVVGDNIVDGFAIKALKDTLLTSNKIGYKGIVISGSFTGNTINSNLIRLNTNDSTGITVNNSTDCWLSVICNNVINSYNNSNTTGIKVGTVTNGDILKNNLNSNIIYAVTNNIVQS